MKQMWINRRYISKITTAIIGGIYAFLGFVGTLVPLDEILPSTLKLWIRIWISFCILLVAWIVCFIVVGKICPEAVRWRGTHTAMVYKGDDGKYYWDYQAVKEAFDA